MYFQYLSSLPYLCQGFFAVCASITLSGPHASETMSLVTLTRLGNAYHGWGSKVNHLSNWIENKHKGLKCIPTEGSGQPFEMLKYSDRHLLFGLVGQKFERESISLLGLP